MKVLFLLKPSLIYVFDEPPNYNANLTYTHNYSVKHNFILVFSAAEDSVPFITRYFHSVINSDIFPILICKTKVNAVGN